MKLPLTVVVLPTVASLFFAGCSTHTRYVETGGPRTIVTTDINIQDFSYAAEEMINSLLASGALDTAPIQPAMLAISRITNNTTQQIDTDLLIKKIRVALNISGKALTTTTIGLGGIAEDPLAQGIQQEKEFYSDKTEPQRMPDFSLSGKIIEKRERQNDIRQVTYTFQLSLTNNAGLAVWEDEKELSKQSKKGVIGW